MNIGKFQVIFWKWGWLRSKGYFPNKYLPIFKFWNLGFIEIRKFFYGRSKNEIYKKLDVE